MFARRILVPLFLFIAAGIPLDAAEPRPKKKIAAVVTTYYHNSHADVIVSRLLETDSLDGQGKPYDLELVSLYVDQFPQNDKSRVLMAKHGVPIFDKIADALTLKKGGKLAVDGILLVAEHGKYPDSETGQTVWPKRRFFEEIAKVFAATGQGVPVFIDKHVADNWTDAKWICDEAARWKAPLMAGSSLPLLWRYPAADVHRDAPLRELVGVSYHTLDGYGFHALEMAQALVERRRGGETGIQSVQTLTGDKVWEAGDQGVYDRELLRQALSKLKHPPKEGLEGLQKKVKDPTLWIIDYADGCKVRILTLNGAVLEWGAAWRYAQSEPAIEPATAATTFYTQEARPFMHFGILLRGIEEMMHSGKSTWPVERTLLTSGTLHALMQSKQAGGTAVATPHLKFPYQSKFDWREPAPPPTDRPIPGQ